MKRITILVLYSKQWHEIAKIVLRNLSDYVDRHKLVLVTYEYDEWGSDYGYRKIEQIKELFAVQSTEFIWSLDLDAIITDMRKNVLEFLDDYHDFWICEDVNGINAGSFIIRKGSWADYFCDFILDQKGKEKMYCEQDAIKKYMSKIQDDPQIKILGHPSINSVMYKYYPEFPSHVGRKDLGDWVEGESFVLHLAAMGMEQRLEIFKNTPIIK